MQTEFRAEEAADDTVARPKSRFIRNGWYVAAWGPDLEAGKMLSRTLLDEQVVFYRANDGRVVALADRCPHRFAPLHLGSVQTDGTLACGYHGLRFNAVGSCVYNPHGNHRIPPAAIVRSYPVVERYSLIWIWMGANTADESLIPSFEVFDTSPPERISTRDYFHIKAGWEIITDNLMDLSHVSFLHDGILGNEDTIDANIEVEQIDRTVYAKRTSRNIAVPEMFDLIFLQDGQRVDVWYDIRWDAPASMLLDTGVCEPGAPRSDGSGLFSAHFLTPETATTTHYFTGNVRQNPPPRPLTMNLEIRTRVSELRKVAFRDQDAAMLEAQQLSIEQSAGVCKPALLGIDAGPIRVSRIVEDLMAAER